jgi:hypothetical protein
VLGTPNAAIGNTHYLIVILTYYDTVQCFQQSSCDVRPRTLNFEVRHSLLDILINMVLTFTSCNAKYRLLLSGYNYYTYSSNYP